MKNLGKYGVVLWSDKNDRTAIIWCDDHGDLAFYRDTETAGDAKAMPEVGDLVCFDIEDRGALRYARDLKAVNEGRFPDIAERLTHAAECASHLTPLVATLPGDNSGDVRLHA